MRRNLRLLKRARKRGYLVCRNILVARGRLKWRPFGSRSFVVQIGFKRKGLSDYVSDALVRRWTNEEFRAGRVAVVIDESTTGQGLTVHHPDDDVMAGACILEGAELPRHYLLMWKAKRRFIRRCSTWAEVRDAVDRINAHSVEELRLLGMVYAVHDD